MGAPLTAKGIQAAAQQAALTLRAQRQAAALLRVRVTLDLTPSMKAILDNLATTSGTTQAEVLRRAVALLKAVKDFEASEEGGGAALVKGNQIVAKLVGF